MKIPNLRIGESFTINLGRAKIKSCDLEMIWIPSGEFSIDSPNGEKGRSINEAQTKITIPSGFWLSKYPITEWQWLYIFDLEFPDITYTNFDHPIENINWYQAMSFCWESNRKLQYKQPDIEKLYKFTLPHEVQWEYACRVASILKYYSDDIVENIAWFKNNSGNSTHPVGEKEPNQWGLYDMLGNVYEWCLNSFTNQPELILSDNAPNADTMYRVARGGHYLSLEDDLRCSKRSYQQPVDAIKGFGMRLAFTDLNYELEL